MTIAVGAIFKNEDEYVLEWLAFHRVVGFSRFYIADNGSSDLTREMLAVLAEYEPITLVDFPDQADTRPQLPAYTYLVKQAAGEVDAIAFIDADEFIVPPPGEATVLPAVQSLLADQTIGAVALNWACYGSAGHVFHEDGLVIERFTKRSLAKFSVNQHYKMLVRPERVAGWDSPHHASLVEGRSVDAKGRDLTYRDGFKNSLSQNVVWDGLRINHYVVKSLEEFLVRKSPKGSASKAGRIKHRRYFELHDKNDETCDEMARFLPAVHQEIERLQAILKAASEKPAAPRAWQQWASSLKSALSRE